MAEVKHDSEIPAQGQQVITACAFIHATFENTTKLFLPKRAATKKFLPDVYELPGGHIDFGEDIVEGLKREIREEFNMEITVGNPFAVFTYMNEVKGSHSIEVIYFAQFVDSFEMIQLHPEDHSQFGWFSKEEIQTKVVSTKKAGNDAEIQAIMKGFSLVNNQP